MPGSDLPDAAAALLDNLASSPHRALAQLVSLVAGQVAGCSGVTAALYQGEFAADTTGQGGARVLHRSGPAMVALKLYGARPRLLAVDDVPLARLLTAFSGALLGSAAEYQQAQRTVLQLREAAQARALADQAKGVLISAPGCTAEDALEQMRQISQRRGLKVTDVARKIIESPGFTGS